MSIFLGSTISGDPSGPLRSKPTFPLVFLYGSSLFPSPAHEKQLPRFFFEEGKFNPPATGTSTFSFEPLSTPDEASMSMGLVSILAFGCFEEMSPVLERPILVLPGGKVSSGVFILGSSAWRQISGGPVEIRLFSPSMSKSEGAEMSVLNLPFRPSISGELA